MGHDIPTNKYWCIFLQQVWNALPDCCCAFFSPTVLVVHLFFLFTVSRCKLWIQCCGNEKLLAHRPEELCNRAYVCPKHFDEHHFNNKMKKKLLPTAVPCKHLPNPCPIISSMSYEDMVKTWFPYAKRRILIHNFKFHSVLFGVSIKTFSHGTVHFFQFFFPHFFSS